MNGKRRSSLGGWADAAGGRKWNETSSIEIKVRFICAALGVGVCASIVMMAYMSTKSSTHLAFYCGKAGGNLQSGETLK